MRKTFGFLMILTLSHFGTEGQQNNRALEEYFLEMFECARGLLITGVPDANFPSLHNLTFSSAELTLSDVCADLDGDLHVEDFVFAGLVDFVIEDLIGELEIIPPSYNIKTTLNFPRPTLGTNYRIDATVEEVKIEGEGILQFDTGNFRTEIETQVSILTGMALEYFNFWVTLEEMRDFLITGLNGDEEYSAEMTSHILENGPAMIYDLRELIHRCVGEFILSVANEGGSFEPGGLFYTIFAECG